MNDTPTARSVVARLVGIGLVPLLLSASACDDSSGAPADPTIVFGAEGNRLWAYTVDGSRRQVVIRSASDETEGGTVDATGRDINAQICFAPDGSRRFIAGEDTDQPNPPQGWGFFELHGDRVGDLSATQVGKLVPTYQGSADNAENYGCGFLSDGRLVTTDVGDKAAGPATGQLVVWFPPFDSWEVRFCKIDVEIGTAGGIWIDALDRVHLTSARVSPGVWRYDPPFPTWDDAAGGCGKVDATGAPLASSVRKSLFIRDDSNLPTPNAVAPAPGGGFYVSSVINGVIAEYDRDGAFVRRILEPPAGETLGPAPFSTGTPLGIAVDAAGTLYYADIGIVVTSTSVGPGRRTGTFRRIEFVDGMPRPPVTMNAELAFPDGVGILQ